MNQPTAPYSTGDPVPSSVPPAGDPDYLHPHQRAVLLVVRAITYLIYALLVAVEIILALGFILLLLGANPSSSFVEWCYRNLDRVMEPFRGIFTPIELGTTSGNNVESIFETSVLFAMIVYAIVAIVIYGLASWLSKRLHRLDLDDRAYRDQMAIDRQAYLDRVNADRIAAAYAVNQAATPPTTTQQTGTPPPTQQMPTGSAPPPPPA